MIYSGLLLCPHTHATQLYNVHLHLFVLFERMGVVWRRIEFTCVAGAVAAIGRFRHCAPRVVRMLLAG